MNRPDIDEFGNSCEVVLLIGTLYNKVRNIKNLHIKVVNIS